MKEKRLNRYVENLEKLENWRNKFTKKQIYMITAIIEILIAILVIYSIVAGPNQNEPAEAIMYGVIVGVVIAVYILCFVFDLDGRDSKERQEKIESNIPEKFHLKTNEFVEVLSCPADIDHPAVKENVEILKELGVKFYAKLTGNGEIVVIKKDSSGKKIGKTDEISNLIYFELNYKPKE